MIFAWLFTHTHQLIMSIHGLKACYVYKYCIACHVKCYSHHVHLTVRRHLYSRDHVRPPAPLIQRKAASVVRAYGVRVPYSFQSRSRRKRPFIPQSPRATRRPSAMSIVLLRRRESDNKIRQRRTWPEILTTLLILRHCSCTFVPYGPASVPSRRWRSRYL